MFGYAGSPTRTVYVGVTLTRSKVKVNLSGLLNFRQLAKLCMLVAMTAAPLRAFWCNICSRHKSAFTKLKCLENLDNSTEVSIVTTLEKKQDLLATWNLIRFSEVRL